MSHADKLPKLPCDHIDIDTRIDAALCQAVVRDFITYKGVCFFRQCRRPHVDGQLCKPHADVKRDKGTVKLFSVFKEENKRRLPLPDPKTLKRNSNDQATDALYERSHLISKSRDQRIADLEKQIDQNENGQEYVKTTITDVENELKASERKVQELKDEIKTKEKELSQARSETKEINAKHDAKIAEHASHMESHKKGIEKLEKEKEELKKEISHLHDELKKAKEEQKSATGKSSDDLKNARAETASVRKELETAQDAMSKLKTQIAEAEKLARIKESEHGTEKAKLQALLSAALATEKDLNAQITALRAELANTRTTITECGGRSSELQKLVDKLKSERTVLEQQLEKQRREMQGEIDRAHDAGLAQTEEEEEEEQDEKTEKKSKGKGKTKTKAPEKRLTLAQASKFKSHIRTMFIELVTAWRDYLHQTPDQLKKANPNYIFNDLMDGYGETLQIQNEEAKFLYDEWLKQTGYKSVRLEELKDKNKKDNSIRRQLYDSVLTAPNSAPDYERNAVMKSFRSYLDPKMKNPETFATEFEKWLSANLKD